MSAPSNYEVTLTDQLPPLRPKAIRIAERLSHLPTELVEPIIQDLPLFRVLELLTVPSCGPSLVWAIEQSPTWSWLFEGHVSRLRRLWVSLNRLSWLWCSTRYIGVRDLTQHHFRYSSPELQSWYSRPGEKVRQGLEKCLTLGIRRILGCDLYNVRPSAGEEVYFGFSIPQIRALCLFLPSTLLSAIKRKDSLGFERALGDAKMPQNVLECLTEGEDKDLDIASGDFSRHDLWTVESAHRFLPFLAQAHKLLKESYSDELLSVAELYEQFPGKLKLPFAPQGLPRNKKHIIENLRRDAKHVLTKPLRTVGKVYIHPNSKEVFRSVKFYRFRYPDTALIPFNWCFVLFEAVRRKYPPSICASQYPKDLIPALVEAETGIRMIYHRNPGRYTSLLERLNAAGMPNTERLDAILNKNAEYAPFLHYVGGPPKPLRELSWLRSFLTCVQWMEKVFHPLASACQGLGECDTRFNIGDLANNALFPPPDYDKFVAEAPAELIASCILRDSKLCDDNTTDPAPRPTPLALHLPDFSSSRGRDIARYLVPSADMAVDIQQLKYDSLKQKLTRYLKTAPKFKGHEDGYRLACELTDEVSDEVVYPNSGQAPNTPQSSSTEVTQSDLEVASRVLRHLLKCSPQPSASVADTLNVLSELSTGAAVGTEEQSHEEPGTWDERVKKYLGARPLPGKDVLPRCYICRLAVHVPHKTCEAMCIPCGDFNMAGSELSMPGNLDLSGKTALVTGARVNLGYHVALRLLRCGARVIVSSRYPRDAVSRYEAEPDSKLWLDRLRVVGADFRSARDAFDLINHTRAIISAWGGRLDILINNAAQTLTDSVKTEGQAVHRENLLKEIVSTTPLLPQQQYSARVRGGAQATIEGAEFTAELNDRVNRVDTSTNDHAIVGIPDNEITLDSEGPAPASPKDMVPLEDKSSWVQSLSEIPYEDVISAHSVNTFVPLILIRELLPLMGDGITPPPASSQASPRRPAGYVINVSSREGIFESSRSNPHKAGRHVHTNMSKAALNMITETEAGPAWARRRVALNTVDPGYMTAAPEMEEAYDGVRPIGWEDGAGRVLWPVAVGEGAGGGDGVVWGRFLKHYGAVRVEPGWGRG